MSAIEMMTAARSTTRGLRSLRQVELRRADRRLQKPGGDRAQQPPLLEGETPQLEVGLPLENLALRVEPRVGRSVRQSGTAPQQRFALELLLLELLLLDALIELELLELARVRRRNGMIRRAQALLHVQIQRVLLLLNLQLAVRAA